MTTFYIVLDTESSNETDWRNPNEEHGIATKAWRVIATSETVPLDFSSVVESNYNLMQHFCGPLWSRMLAFAWQTFSSFELFHFT